MIGFQKLLDLALIHAFLQGDAREHGMVGQLQALRKIRLVQALLQPIREMGVFSLGQLGQAVGVEGIGIAGFGIVEIQPRCASHLRNTVDALLSALEAQTPERP